jgi:hypothetical protein
MAVAGGSRQEVAFRLRDQFGIAAPEAILDDVFGSGSAGTTRVPWT